ncbi:MAG: hypothetical protein KF873_17910 [Gemmataceae bacterium]|nr:hypothetical protein [Gemmataceae bacterium]
MNRTLPEPLMKKAERLAIERGFDSVTDYLSDLLEREESPAHPFADREAEVESALLEGLASGPATPMTAEDWNELKRRVVEVHAAKAP